jgi:hypothetical protein
MGRDRSKPPSEWSPFLAERVTDDLYVGWPPDDAMPWFWHWCTVDGRWVAAGTADHTLVERDPLHLEPSLLWPCCGMHGWVRNGAWETA